MRTIARPLLLLHPDRVFQERVRRACKERYSLRVVPGWEQLREEVAAAPPAALVIVDPYEEDSGKQRISSTLRDLLREFPSTTVLAAFDVRPGSYDDLRTLSEWGVSGVICLDEEDTTVAIAQRLRSAHGRPLRALLHRALPPNTPGRTLSLLSAAAEVVSVGGSASDLARRLHVTTRTLLRWCKQAGLPPPRQLLAWMRILLAAELLDDPGRTVLGVASACGYSSDGSLRNVMRNYLGTTPKLLRQGGAFHAASYAFLKALTEARAPKAQGPAWSIARRVSVN